MTTRSWYTSPSQIKPGSPLPDSGVTGPYDTYTGAHEAARARYAVDQARLWVVTVKESVTDCSMYAPCMLPFGYEDTRVVKNEVGTFVAQPVGSTEYTTGLHVYVHLAGEPEAVHGLAAFHASIQEDGAVSWSRMHPHYTLKHERADDLLPVMLGISRDWVRRDPPHYVCHVRDMAVRELRTHWYNLRSAEDSVKHLTKLLSDPVAPTTVGKKGEDGKWHDEPATPEERAARREFWERNLARYTATLSKYHAEHDARIAQLTQAKKQLDEWLRAKDKDRGSVPTLPPATPA